MAFDKNNKQLKAGDVVLVPARVVSADPSSLGINVLCEIKAEDANHNSTTFAIHGSQCAIENKEPE